MSKNPKVLSSLFLLALFLSIGAHKASAAQSATASDPASVLVMGGLGTVEGLAVSPQGALFAGASSGKGPIIHIFSRNTAQPFVETGSRSAGMAFDLSGDLLVAGKSRKAVLRITPWGEVSVFTGDLTAPEDVAVASSGDVYITDPAASRVYRISPQRETTVFTTDVKAPRNIAVSPDNRRIFVSDSERTIWRFGPDGNDRTQFAAFTDEGDAAGMALDEQGNLYVARNGGGKVSVLSPEGKLIDSYSIPGQQVTDIAFGGLDLKTLFVSEAAAGAVYKLRVPQRSQRLPWEVDKPLRITQPVDGDILNRHDGEQTKNALRIMVKGVSPAQGDVRVNGASVPVRDGQFEAPVMLRQRETRIVAAAGGSLRDEVTVLWDRDSFPRYRVSTDDNILFLKDIAQQADTYRSIFENPYLAFWRQIHQKYGTKIHFNIYYETEGFNLSQMPDKFRDEWRQNAGWIHLSFHARANDPDRPYVHSSAEQIREDYRLVTQQIERFAGKELLVPLTTVHWGETPLAAARALRAEGVRTLVGYFTPTDSDFPSVCYYLPLAQWRQLMGRDYWRDNKEDLIFIRHDIVINTIPLDQIVPYLEKITADPHQSEVMELMIHEQYFYPDYRAYEPDYRERVERAIKFVTKRGYKPVFYNDGFLGD